MAAERSGEVVLPAGEAAAVPARKAVTVEFDRVCKGYPDGLAALRDVTLRIDRGEFVFVVGPTGAGKSTLMKMIYREETPSSGRVLVQGCDVGRMPAREVPFLRRRIGVVFQDFRLLPSRTAWENVAFALDVTGAPAAEVSGRVREALILVGLTARADALPAQLSAGEQQRVSVARAMVHRPPLLLADEPTGNLDPETSWEIVRLLSQINGQGTTVIVATHDKAVVDMLGKRVVALERGAVTRDEPRGAYGGR